jgi:hypothetical protein
VAAVNCGGGRIKPAGTVAENPSRPAVFSRGTVAATNMTRTNHPAVCDLRKVRATKKEISGIRVQACYSMQSKEKRT